MINKLKPDRVRAFMALDASLMLDSIGNLSVLPDRPPKEALKKEQVKTVDMSKYSINRDGHLKPSSNSLF